MVKRLRWIWPRFGLIVFDGDVIRKRAPLRRPLVPWVELLPVTSAPSIDSFLPPFAIAPSLLPTRISSEEAFQLGLMATSPPSAMQTSHYPYRRPAAPPPDAYRRL